MFKIVKAKDEILNKQSQRCTKIKE